jgi:ATP-dependent Lhr-like helicase
MTSSSISMAGLVDATASERRPFDRLSPALQYQIVNTLGFTRACGRCRSWRSTRSSTATTAWSWPRRRAARPRRRSSRCSRAMDGGLAPGVGALPLAHPRAAQQPGGPRSPLRRADRAARVQMARRHVPRARAARFLASPADILLTTPESLEAMLMSARVPARPVRRAAGGGHRRGPRVCRRRSRRASLGAARASLGRGCAATTSSGSGSPRRWATRGDPRVARRQLDAGAGGWCAAAAAAKRPGDHPRLRRDAPTPRVVVERLHPGRKRLVFVDSRRRVEELGKRTLLGLAAWRRS